MRIGGSSRKIGWWVPGPAPQSDCIAELRESILRVKEPFFVLQKDGRPTAARGGRMVIGDVEPPAESLPVLAQVPAVNPEDLGDAQFCKDHGVKYPYYTGSMAHGIASAALVESMAREGILSFFGSAGLRPSAIEAAIDRLKALGNMPYGFNLIHTPAGTVEEETVELYIRKGIRLVEASAFMDVAPSLVRFRASGLREESGRVVAPNRIIAKVSRVEVATKFFSPPPENILRELADSGKITAEEAALAARIPLAQDVTAEADSAGHTDNRPSISLIPTMLALRDRMQAKHGYEMKLRVGAAGGISTPASAAAAFSMGAAYVATGSVNQACVESGTSDAVRELLGQAQQADTAMAPSADMFEMGVRVQVLKRGTLFPMRASKLGEIYNSYAGMDAIPAQERASLEKNIFMAPLEEIWQQTRGFFEKVDPAQITLAERNPKHKMGLVFRWYLGLSSHWAIAGKPERKFDFQVWCGPAMGAFNEWARGSFLEKPPNRKAATVALNLLHGAAVMMRLNLLRCHGIDLHAELTPRPLEDSEIRRYL